jgi:class 3 adenylate cyclase/tetratricopeptide (TPR) repeat protein
MTCLRCHSQNRDGARFCRVCGATLTQACPACGTELAVGSRFCDGCGAQVVGNPAPAGPAFGSPASYTPKHLAEKILVSRSALEGERKQVTVLFADISGFTGLSERLDPEDVHRLITRAFELILAEVHRYEGTVNQFLGDGIMALFGAPVAHEDHARRAVHAALAIGETLAAFGRELERDRRITFRVRQGLNTGLVVVGSIGNDLRMDYTAVGDTTNVAARMLQAAEPDRILVAESTRRLVSDHFEMQPLGPLAVKGRREPVGAWLVQAVRPARTRVEVRAERGLTPFVGRERERRALRECFEQARAGRGQVVFVVGEPGIGKSRLLYEFRRSLGAEATWLEGRCVSFGRSMALHPIIDLLRRGLGIDEGDDESAIAGKIESQVEAVGADLRPSVPFLKYLLSVDPGDPSVVTMEPQHRRGELFDALRRLIARAAARRPHVMVLEDLHWVDQATEEFLLRLADLVPTSRLLQVCTYRPGYAQPFGDRTYHTRLVLSSLSPRDSATLAEGMLHSDRLPDPLQALIAEKAEGNPFFVEEVVASLRESGALRFAEGAWTVTGGAGRVLLPDTIQDVIMSRIDRLREPAKRTLQVAAVIGREFPGRLLERVVDAEEDVRSPLAELKASELIYERGEGPEVAYTFKHALTQEVAYGSLLIQHRRTLHERIARAIEQSYADRLPEHYEVLALHFRRAEAPTKALEYLMKAADKAARAFAIGEALALYGEAEEAARALGDRVTPETWIALHRAKFDLEVLRSDFDRARIEGERALEVARGSGNIRAEGEVLAGMSMASVLAHRFEQALDEARQAVSIGEQVGAPQVVAAASLATVFVFEVTGRLAEAAATVERVFAITRASGDVVNRASALVFAAELKHWEDRFAEASAMYAEGMELGRRHNVMGALLEGGFMWGVNLTGHGRYDEAIAVFEEGLALAEKVGDENYTPRYLNSLGRLYFECGDLGRAEDLNRRAAEGARRRRDDESIANADLNLADVVLARGDHVLAREMLEEARHTMNHPATSEWGRWRYSMHLFASLGEAALAAGDLDELRRCADMCLELAVRSHSPKYIIRGWRLRGEFAAVRGDHGGAVRALREALRGAEGTGSPAAQWRTQAALGRILAAHGRPDDAHAAYAAGREVLQGLMRSIHDSRLRVALENDLAIRRVIDLGAPR